MKLSAAALTVGFALGVVPGHEGARATGSLDATVRAGFSAMDSAREAVGDRAKLDSEKAMCAPPAVPPDTPSSPVGQHTAWFADWSTGKSLILSLWRDQGANGCTILFLRAGPTLGVPFICSSALTVLQGGSQYSVKISQTAGGPSFCGDLFVPTVFILEPRFAPLFNIDGPITLVYEGVFNNYSGSIQAYTPWTTSLSPQIGLWWNPSESGTGYAIDVQNGALIMTIYSYRPDGEPQWYLTAGPLTNGNRNYTGTLDKYRAGQCISCPTYNAPTNAGSEGSVSVVFNGNTSATVTLPGGRVTNIVPF